MIQRDEILQRVLVLIDRLSLPISIFDAESGWTEDSRVAMLQFFERLCNDLKNGIPVSQKPEYRSIARGMDHWGIISGSILDEAAEISANIRDLNN